MIKIKISKLDKYQHQLSVAKLFNPLFNPVMTVEQKQVVLEQFTIAEIKHLAQELNSYIKAQIPEQEET